MPTQRSRHSIVRLNSSGITELNIAPLGENRIEIKLPKFATSAETDRFKELLESTGKLELRILASEESEYANLKYGDEAKEDGYKFKWLELANDDSVNSGALVKDFEGKKYAPVQVIDDYSITGKSLSEISPSTSSRR